MLSKYNIYIKQNSDIWIYNNFKKKIICVSQEEYYRLINNTLEINNPKLYKKLVQYGIVYLGIDEVGTLLDYYKKNIEDLRLNIMIMSSTACNFNCSYCYEEFIPKQIDYVFEKAFIEFLNKNTVKYKSVFIEWFGGEPLLAKERVISISKKAKKICIDKKKPFICSITTNGYYLDYATFYKLLEGNIIYFQVTIDGNKKWHDKYRPLKNGRGTYDVVFNNLLSIKKNVEKNKVFRLTIRNNVSIENLEACMDFKQIFQENFGDDDRFQLFQFPIKDWGGNKIKEIKQELFDTEYDLLIDKLVNYRMDIFEGIVSSCCLATKKYGFVIDPEYNVYKCNHYIQNRDIGDKYNKIGWLESGGNLVIDDDKNNEWISMSIEDQCRICFGLPNCLTTCPLHKMHPENNCKQRIKTELENKIKNYILLKKR